MSCVTLTESFHYPCKMKATVSNTTCGVCEYQMTLCMRTCFVKRKALNKYCLLLQWKMILCTSLPLDFSRLPLGSGVPKHGNNLIITYHSNSRKALTQEHICRNIAGLHIKLKTHVKRPSLTKLFPHSSQCLKRII